MTANLAKRYEAAAPSWGRQIARLGFPAAYDSMVAEALRRVPLPPHPARPLRAADLGCGEGALAQSLVQALAPGSHLTLLDLSPAMLAQAVLRPGLEKAQMLAGDLMAGDLPESSFDIVAAAHLVEHLDDFDGALKRMGRLLRPGGTLILSVSRPHWCSRLVWLNWRHRSFTEAAFCAALQQAGFAEIQAWPHAFGPPRRLSLAYAARRPFHK
jgi:ubiquinone/menaquinone biosynthesis C-methylase UbiE